MERSNWMTGVVVAAAVALAAPALAQEERVTACTALDICYCVNTRNLDAIKVNVDRLRQLIDDNRSKGKAIGYLSVPISPAGGGAYAINDEAAKRITGDVTCAFGASSVWILNPSTEGPSMTKPSGADYMYMWTQILEGRSGHGEDFDFFYFAGPTDFSRYFLNPPGNGDCKPADKQEKLARQDVLDYFGKLDEFFDRRVASDPAFKALVEQGKVNKVDFRKYYGLRASVAFSYGSHDEWNIARLVNERRRGATKYGIANQLAIFFDGEPVNPGGYETGTAAGDTGRCIN